MSAAENLSEKQFTNTPPPPKAPLYPPVSTFPQKPVPGQHSRSFQNRSRDV